MRHECSKAANGKYWSLCVVCEGRVHLSGCTTKRNPSRDCCEARHVKLHNAGQTRGIGDSSLPMLGTHA